MGIIEVSGFSVTFKLCFKAFYILGLFMPYYKCTSVSLIRKHFNTKVYILIVKEFSDGKKNHKCNLSLN